MKNDYTEVGDMIKASKGLYSWEFTLDDKRHKIELSHSRITGKRVILSDGQEISSCLKYTYNYTYSFPLDGHYLTLIQISPDQYDLRIDNVSFMLLKNKTRYKKPKKEKEKKDSDDEDEGEKRKKRKKKKMTITFLMMLENLILVKMIIIKIKKIKKIKKKILIMI